MCTLVKVIFLKWVAPFLLGCGVVSVKIHVLNLVLCWVVLHRLSSVVVVPKAVLRDRFFWYSFAAFFYDCNKWSNGESQSAREGRATLAIHWPCHTLTALDASAVRFRLLVVHMSWRSTNTPHQLRINTFNINIREQQRDLSMYSGNRDEYLR